MHLCSICIDRYIIIIMYIIIAALEETSTRKESCVRVRVWGGGVIFVTKHTLIMNLLTEN